MSGAVAATRFPRRELLKAGGTLLVGFALPIGAQQPQGVALVLGPDQPDQNSLDTWLAIHEDNTATVFHGYVELGQGATTALLQVAGEELDLTLDQMRVAPLATGRTPNQGATAASAAIMLGGPRVRAAAAEARQTLLRRAAERLGAPVERLRVTAGVVSVEGQSGKAVSYGELLGEQPFDVPFTGSAPVKPPRDYRLVGTRAPRKDIPGKVAGTYEYLQHARVPGMLHGRVVRPPGQGSCAEGARVATLDETSIRHVAGARVVQRGDFVGVVAPREWDAVRAARELRIAWETNAALPSSTGVFAQMRAAATIDRVVLETGDAAAAVHSAAHVITQSYRAPYQAHAPFAPNCALAEVRDGEVRVTCGTQNLYETRAKLARVAGVAVEKVHVEYRESSGTFGRSCFDDAAQAAVILSQAVGAPVRVQFMRADEHGWDNFGPAQLADVRMAIDDAGKLVAYEFEGWQHGWTTVETSEQLALGTPPAEITGPIAMEVSPRNLGSMYAIANRRLVNRRVPGIVGYLKAANLRSPLDIGWSFASEQTIDELAALARVDASEFRRRNIADERWRGVLDAVTRAARWRPRVPEQGRRTVGRIAAGRGIALGTHTSSYGAAVADVEVDTTTGVIAVRHLYGALDAGLVVNPGFVENQISGMLVQAASRMLKEEVTFDAARVTSLDWVGYPILRFAECPAVTPIVVQRLHEPYSGGGEEVLAPASAAIANAFADATGVRLREFPLTPPRVLAALRAAAA